MTSPEWLAFIEHIRREPGLATLAHDLTQLVDADAQQIAALRAENEKLQQQLDEWVKAYGQQAALTAQQEKPVE